MADVIDDIINRSYQSIILNQDVVNDTEEAPAPTGLGAPMSGREGTTSQQDVEQEQEQPRPTGAVMDYLKRLAKEYGYNAKAPQTGVRVPATTPTLDTTKMYDTYNTPLYDFMRNNEGGMDEDVSVWVRENRDLPSEVLDEMLRSIQDVYDEYGDRKETRMIDAPEGQGELSNPEPLYRLSEEIDPGTIDTKELGLMSKPVKKNSLLEFIASGEGGYDSANRGTIKVGNTDKIVGSQMVASRGGKKISDLTVDEILKYQAIKDPNNEDRLFAVGKYQTDNRTFPMAVKALGLSGDTVFSPEVQEQVGLYLVSEKPGRKRLSNYLKNIGDVSAERAMLDLAMEFASVPVPYAIKKGTYGKWPKVDLKAGDSFYASGKGGNKAQHTVAETLEVLEENKGSVPSANTRGVSPRPRLRDDE